MGIVEGLKVGRVRVRLAIAIVAVFVFWFAHKAEQPTVFAESQAAVKEIDIHASQFKFAPAEITLKQGEPVKLVLISDDVPHGLAVAGLPIHNDIIAGHPTILMITPKQTGTFAGKCSKFCGSGHRDMYLTVHVVP